MKVWVVHSHFQLDGMAWFDEDFVGVAGSPEAAKFLAEDWALKEDAGTVSWSEPDAETLHGVTENLDYGNGPMELWARLVKVHGSGS